MAISPSTAWEVRTTGDDANAGGYVPGSSGQDYSRQDAAQLSLSDADAAGTTNLHSATGGFTSSMVGNLVQLSGGTLTAGFYQVTAFVDANNVTLDRSPGTGSGSTAKVGGALKTVTKLAAAMVFGNRAWIKSGTYNEAGTVTFAQTGTPSATAPPSRLIGYDAARGDITPATASPNRPVIRSANTTTGFLFSGSGWRIECLEFGLATSGQKLVDIGSSTSNIQLVGCKLAASATFFLFRNTANNPKLVERCEFTGFAGSGASACPVLVNGPITIRGCYIHDNTGVVAAVGNSTLAAAQLVAIGNVLADNAGGIGVRAGASSTILRNTIVGSGTDGIRLETQSVPSLVQGNVLASNGGYGLAADVAGQSACYQLDGNAYYANTAGARNNVDDAGAVNPVNGSTPYTNARDVALTVDPFVDAASGDYRLNDLVGGGADCRGAGSPDGWPGLPFAAYPDLGAVQHLDANAGDATLANQAAILNAIANVQAAINAGLVVDLNPNQTATTIGGVSGDVTGKVLGGGAGTISGVGVWSDNHAVDGVANDTSYYGTCTGGTATTITLKAGTTFPADALKDSYIFITSGTGKYGWGIVTGNTAADPPVVTIDRAWQVATPVSGDSAYQIGAPATVGDVAGKVLGGLGGTISGVGARAEGVAALQTTADDVQARVTDLGDRVPATLDTNGRMRSVVEDFDNVSLGTDKVAATLDAADVTGNVPAAVNAVAAGAIGAAAVAAGALDGKGDWTTAGDLGGLSTFDPAADGVTLAAAQPNYAPAKAGDAMTVSDKTGFKLSADGLDAIATIEPTVAIDGAMGGWNFRQLLRWGVMALARATRTIANGSGEIEVQTLAGARSTGQAIADDGEGNETLGAPGA